MEYLFSSESVTSGHPDKLCDLISDSILDECIRLDSNARVAIEVFVKGLDGKNGLRPKSHIIIGGEISIDSEYEIDYEKIARKCAVEIGYTGIEIGMDATNNETCEVQILISMQSKEISQGITIGEGVDLEQGAGDQGIIFGFATNESEKYDLTKDSYMPLPILLAHKLTLEITKKRLGGLMPWARPDGKSQVTVAYDETGSPSYIDTIVIAVQHKDMIGDRFKNQLDERKFIIDEIKEKIIKDVIPLELITTDLKIIVNGTGRFCKGGPHADAGLTGRKIIVDTYGGSGRHGGGAFSGKDPTKVDRSAAYYARWVAKHIVASGIAKTCEIQLAYSIGLSEPISINLNVETFGTSNFSNLQVNKIVLKYFDFRPASIINELGLNKPIYATTSSGGHFGRKSNGDNFPWEKINTDKIKSLKNLFNNP